MINKYPLMFILPNWDTGLMRSANSRTVMVTCS